MAKTPTFFDYLNLRDELRGVTAVEERRAVIAKHVEAAANYFRNNNQYFPLDYESQRALELRADIEETAERLARGEGTEAGLSGVIQAWQVNLCEEYLAKARPRREEEAAADESAAEPEPQAAEHPPDFVSKECAEGTRPKQGAGKRETPRRRAPRQPAEPPPAQPGASSPQGSLFG